MRQNAVPVVSALQDAKDLIMQIIDIYNKYKECGAVTTDTRTLKGGEMFFALKGENFDGNEYALKALEAGARYAVINSDSQAAASGDSRLVIVEDTLKTLQELARWHRSMTFVDGKPLRVVALTGTNGKTTTKELIRAVLSVKYNVTATEGNLNNSIGVPLTLLKINSETQIAVVEMGASHPGDIKELVDIALPDYGLITNVGKAHLQGFGSLEGVMATKGELYDYLAEHRKIAFVNVDNPLLVQMASKRQRMQIVPYGVNNNCAKVVVDEGGSPFLSMVIPNPCITDVKENGASEWLAVKTNLIGAYNADNVLAALCISSYLDVETADAIAAIAEYVPSNNRSQLTKTERNSLVVDAYNANPTSMKAAIENFAQLGMPSKVLVLGDMLELGEDSLKEHIRIIKMAMELDLDMICLVGSEFGKACCETTDDKIMSFKTSCELAGWLKENPVSGSVILIKGSRGTKMENIIDTL